MSRQSQSELSPKPIPIPATDSAFIVLDALPLGAFVLDANWVILFWNNSLETWTGIQRDQIVGHAVDRYFPHLRHPRYQSRLSQVFEGGPPVLFSSQLHPHLIPAQQPDGSLRVQNTTVSAIPGSQPEEFYALWSIQDVTDLSQQVKRYRKAQSQAWDEVKARQQAEAKLRAVVEDTSAFFSSLYMYSLDCWEYDYVSPGAEAIFGYSELEIVANPALLIERILPVDRDRIVLPALAQLLVSTEHLTIEYRLQHKQGAILWISHTLSSHRDETADAWYVTGIVVDITQRKQLELQLQESEQRFRNTFEYAGIGMAWVDLEGRWLRVNAALCQITGYSEAELLATNVQSISHPEDMVADQANADRLLRGEISVYQMEKRYRHKQGYWVWGLLIVTVVRDQAGAPLYYICQIHDISDRKRAEESLRRYERMIAATPDCVSLIDRNYVYQVVNQTYLSWHRKSYDEIVGHSIADLLGEDLFQSVSKPLFDRCLAGESNIKVEKWLDYADGQRRFICATYSSYLEPDGTIIGVVVNIHDLTQLKQAETQLRDLSSRLELAVKSAHIGIWEWDLLNDRLWWDARMHELHGIPVGTFAGTYAAWQAHLHQADAPAHYAALQATLQHDQDLSIEFRVIWPDGSLHWLEAHALVQWDPQGHPRRLIGVNLDITDRKRAETDLQTSQQQYQTLVENSPDLIERFDPQLRHLYVSPALATLVGMPTTAFLGKTCRELGLATDMVEAWEAAVARLFATRQKQTIEFSTPTQQGTRSFEMAIVPELTPTQEIASILCISRDVTDRQTAAMALYQQAERARLLAEIAQRIRQTLDLAEILNTTVTEVRQFLQCDRVVVYRFEPDWSGLIVAESVGAGWPAILAMHITDTYFVAHEGNLYQSGDIKAVDDIYQAGFTDCHLELLESMRVRAKLVVPIMQATGPWGLLIAHHCQGIRHWQTLEIDLIKQLATQLEIAIQQSELLEQVRRLNTNLETQVQKRTQELRQSLAFEALLKRITDKVRDSLDEGQILQTAVQELAFGLDLDGCDAALYDLDNRTSTIAYECIRSILLPAQGIQISMDGKPDIYHQLLQGRSLQFCLVNLAEFDSCRVHQKHTATILACPIIDERSVLGDLWLFKPATQSFSAMELRLVQQVTNQCAIALRQSRLYQTAQAQVQALEQLNRLKDDFLSTVSHELRTPMSNIKMATQMLEISLQALGVFDDPANVINRYFTVLREEGQREINLINDLLDLARLDAGQEVPNPVTLDLRSFLPYLTEPFVERTRSQQQQLILQIAPDLPPLVTDPTYLERIVTELLNNACKYTPAHETITLAAQARPTGILIQMSNSGVEMAAAECERIFDKFYRIPNNDPWKYGGTGLGLALVKRMTDFLGGTIHVESHDRQVHVILQLTPLTLPTARPTPLNTPAPAARPPTA